MISWRELRSRIKMAAFNRICFIAILVILVVIGCTNGDEEEWKPKTSDEIKSIRRECLKENPLSPEQISQMQQLEFPDEEPVRKYIQCTGEKLGVFCSQMGYHADRLSKQFKMNMDEAEVFDIAQGCIDQNTEASSADVWAFRGHRCIMQSKVGDRVRAYLKHKKEEEAKNAATS